jgi:hypothetical protein
MSMMPPGGVRRIDRRLIHQTAWKVHAQKVIIAILHKLRPTAARRAFQGQFANARVGAGHEK